MTFIESLMPSYFEYLAVLAEAIVLVAKEVK